MTCGFFQRWWHRDQRRRFPLGALMLTLSVVECDPVERMNVLRVLLSPLAYFTCHCALAEVPLMRQLFDEPRKDGDQ